jgi:hypothetical protein
MASTSSTSTPSSSSSDSFAPTEWTQQSMLSDLTRQKGLLIGIGVTLGLVFLFLRLRGSAPEEKAARRLVRNWRKVDDASDVRDLLGSNVPTIVRPALLMALHEIERQVHKGFESLERDIERL